MFCRAGMTKGRAGLLAALCALGRSAYAAPHSYAIDRRLRSPLSIAHQSAVCTSFPPPRHSSLGKETTGGSLPGHVDQLINTSVAYDKERSASVRESTHNNSFLRPPVRCKPTALPVPLRTSGKAMETETEIPKNSMSQAGSHPPSSPQTDMFPQRAVWRRKYEKEESRVVL